MDRDSDVKISLTSFTDFVLRPDSQKLTVIRSLKNRTVYHPAFDYWKPMREAIVEMFRSQKNTKVLRHVIESASSEKRSNFYRSAMGIEKFLKKYKDVTFFEPTGSVWSYKSLSIVVNPELGLYIEGVPHLIKLYFKEFTSPAEVNLTKERGKVATWIMDKSLKDTSPDYSKMAFLNVSKGQLVVPSTSDELDIILKCSADSFITMWDSL